jgi:hypothetical protein
MSNSYSPFHNTPPLKIICEKLCTLNMTEKKKEINPSNSRSEVRVSSGLILSGALNSDLKIGSLAPSNVSMGGTTPHRLLGGKRIGDLKHACSKT